MSTIDFLREFFGWCAIINIIILMFSVIFLILLRGPASRIHASMFNLDESDLSRAYFQLIAQYKIAIILFNIVPYFALKLM
jgi:hypothetical protein